MSRKHHLSECEPKWVAKDGVRCGIRFTCPEANGGCDGYHVVPSGIWTITGEIPNVTITPSVACRGACQMHITVTNGHIDFATDSKSGPDWEAK